MRLALIFLLALAAPAAAAQPGPPPSRTAAELVERAAEALGGADRIRRVRSLAWETRGDLFWLNQGRTPDRPMELQLRQRQFAHLGERLVYVALDFSGPESSFERRTVLRSDGASADLLELASLSPVAVVRHLLDRPADLRLLDRPGAGSIVVGPFLGRLVELELGADGLPRSASYVIADDLFGDSVRRFDYLDYRARDGWMLPGRVRQTDAGRIALDVEVASFAADGARPLWSLGLEPRQAHPPGEAGSLIAEPLAPRVHFLRRHGGADYHGLAVELDEGWMVIETPAGIGDGSALRETLAAIADKPILYAAATHHHDDHSAGMPALAGEDVTVLTTPGNLDYFRTMVAAPRGFARGGAAHVVAVEDGQRLGPVQFLSVGPLAHAEEMLVFYLPEHRLLFHSDMGRFNDDGSVEPARPQTCALLAFIERRGLDVERIVSGHGRPGTVDDLRRSVALRETPCP